MIERPPLSTESANASAFAWLEEPSVREAVERCNDDYLYWSELKYKKAVGGLSPSDLWACVRASRAARRVYVWRKYGVHFAMTNRMQQLCHLFDMKFRATTEGAADVRADERARYVASSLMEEAISSSQMEGASTTRKVAKDMLRKGLTPRGRSEQMICNNYKCILFIAEHKDEPLTEQLLLKVHALMTHGTLERTTDEGRLRTDDTVVVENGITHEVVHTPPSHEELPEFVAALCAFFNDEGAEPFLHPVLRAVVLHFMVAYAHPFVDGNGRTARALFYWYMLRSGYWMTEYLSISRIIYRSKKGYERSFLQTEADANDMGYFITYHLDVLERAFHDWEDYVGRKRAQVRRAGDFLEMDGINERQAYILSLLQDDPHIRFTIRELQTRLAVSQPTARADVEGLVERGLLRRVPINQVKNAYVRGEGFEEVCGG